MIDFNRQIVRGRRQDFEADDDKIFRFFTALSTYDNVHDHKERIIKKAAHVLAGLAWHQYFNEANKETATRMTLYYLRKNGLDLPLASRMERKELYSLLVKTIEKFPQDQTIYSEVEEYLRGKTVFL